MRCLNVSSFMFYLQCNRLYNIQVTVKIKYKCIFKICNGNHETLVIFQLEAEIGLVSDRCNAIFSLIQKTLMNLILRIY